MNFENMSLPEYLRRYSTEEACLYAVFASKWSDGFVCPSCEHGNYYRLSGRRSVECASCGGQTSILAETVFENTHVALQLWFLIMYFVAQDKGGASAVKLANQLDMRYGTVLRMLNKLRDSMTEAEKTLKLVGYIEKGSKAWNVTIRGQSRGGCDG